MKKHGIIYFIKPCYVLSLQKEILSSLILSMLQQMLMDDKEEEVREAVVRSLGLLFGFINDADKYSQVQSRANFWLDKRHTVR